MCTLAGDQGWVNASACVDCYMKAHLLVPLGPGLLHLFESVGAYGPDTFELAPPIMLTEPVGHSGLPGRAMPAA
ncbi:hypothetical protein OY671_012941, partial [Metschnikowia pulcherrima]